MADYFGLILYSLLMATLLVVEILRITHHHKNRRND